MKLTIIAGARPNFMKVAPVIHAVQNAQKEGKDIFTVLFTQVNTMTRI